MVCKQEPPGPRPTLSSTAKVTIRWVVPGQNIKANNIFYARGPANPTLGDLTNLATAVATGLTVGTNAMVNVVSTAWTVDTVEALDYSGASNEIGYHPTSLPGK